MRSSLHTIGRLRQQNFQYKNPDLAHKRLLEWEKWFKGGGRIPRPSTPAPNKDAAAIDALVSENSSAIYSEMFQLPSTRKQDCIPQLAGIVQVYMISPPIIAEILKILDELLTGCSAQGDSSSGLVSSLAPVGGIRGRIQTDTAYRVFIEKALDTALRELMERPATDTGAARAIPRIKAIQKAIRPRSVSRSSGPDR